MARGDCAAAHEREERSVSDDCTELYSYSTGKEVNRQISVFLGGVFFTHHFY